MATEKALAGCLSEFTGAYKAPIASPTALAIQVA